jgi:hypothetical protein
MKNREHSLFYANDPTELRANIARLINLKYFVKRCSPHHLKVERVNFWPTTGSIQIDGQPRRPERGWSAFLALLTAEYPRVARTRSDFPNACARPAVRNGFPAESADVKFLVLDMGEGATLPSKKLSSEMTVILPCRGSIS